MSVTGPDSKKLSTPVGERDHRRGAAGAPVTLVEYGDYECPDSFRSYRSVGEVQRRLPDHLRYVFRNFPLTEKHPHAGLAAEAAEAAASQGRFWEMYGILFENQRALEADDLLRYAEDLRLDRERFEKELKNGTHAGRVWEDIRSGLRSGVGGTPTLFINGVHHTGPYDPDTLAEAVERASGTGASGAGETGAG